MATPIDDDPYADGALYDLEYADHHEDVPWYVLQARRSRGPVLELGCGTGRLTVPIAQAGVQITGVDRATPMLETLRGKLGAESDEVRSRVALLEGDYETLEPGGPFGAVLWPFNAMHHCAGPDAVVAVLRAALGWVKPRGLLALDCYLPDLDLYDRDPEARFEPRAFRDPRSGQPMESWEQGWWDADAHVHHVLYVYRHPDGREERTRLQLRMYPLAEVRRMLAVAGWELEHESRDFSGAPLEEDALKYVAIARRR